MRFFFYGTLIAGSGNRAAEAAHARLRDLGPAFTRGRLHAIADPQGWYPALLTGNDVVAGRLYEAVPAFGEDDLAQLDAWEDCDPADPEASLYLREMLAVTGAAGTCQAQAYRYNRPLPADAPAIAGGDFAAWLIEHGAAAFGTAPR